MPNRQNTLITALSSMLLISLYFNFRSSERPSTFFEVVSNKKGNGDNSKRSQNQRDEDTKKILDLYYSLNRSEFKKFSQNKEDGVTERILVYLSMTTPPGFFVEFGCGDGNEVNSRYTREKYNWKGLLLSGFNENKEINLYKEMITHDNIVSLFEKYSVPIEIDLLSVDTDYADYWIMESIFTKYKPKVIIHEVNQQKTCVTVPKPIALFVWEGHDEYCGASVCAYHCLAKRFGYTMVYCESNGVNCFMIRDDLLKKALKVDLALVRKVLNPAFLYKQLPFSYQPTNKPWHTVNCTL